MLAKTLSRLSDFFIFVLVFSFYNDNFMVEHFGTQALKALFFLFYLFYFFTFVQNFKTMTDTQDKMFFAFFLFDITLLLIQMFFGWNVSFAPAGFMLIAILSVILYFSRYPLQKLLYMVWISMMASVVICYFSPPLDEWTFRKSGGTDDPNEFSTQLLIFLFAAFYLYTQNKSKLFLAVSIVFFTYGILHAASMSSFLMLGVLGLLGIIRLLFIKPQIFFSTKTLLVLLLISAVATQINPIKFEVVSNILSRTKDTGTAGFRMHSWIAGKHMVEKNPLLGVGVDEFRANEYKYEEGHMLGSSPSPHNVYIKLIAESGIVIFLLFVLFIGTIIVSNLKILFYTNEWWLMMILFSSLLMGLTLGFLYDKFFWISIALMMNINYELNRRKAIS